MKKYLYFLLGVLFFFSCKNLNKNRLAVLLPDPMPETPTFAYNNAIVAKVDSSLYKIYTLIDVSCSSCLPNFKKWNNFYSKMDSVKNFQLIVFCNTKNNFELLKYLFENNEIPKVNYPIMLDTNAVFKKMNVEIIKNPMKFSVLTNPQNEVILIGDPIGNNEDSKLFLNKVQELNAK